MQSSELTQAPGAAAPVSKKMIWTGRVISAIPVLLMLFSGVAKIAKLAPVVHGFVHFGYPESVIVTLGVVEILCCVVYVIPRTAVLGAILLVGYLGGATATNVRVSDPSYFIPIVLGVLVWLGLYLRDARLRALIPLRS
jgi:hypothetical protein